MSKNKCNTRVSKGKIDAKHWGNLKEYTDCLQLIDERDAVCEGGHVHGRVVFENVLGN